MLNSARMKDCIALIVAAGRGTRFGAALPKQYRLLAGRPVLRHGVERLAGHPRVAAVQVVIHPADRDLYAAATAGLGLPPPVVGGATRQASVLAGLEALPRGPAAKVLIHDAARPLLSPAIIDRLADALDRHPGAIPVVPVADTLKRGAGGLIAATVPRAGLYRAQTPQAFRRDVILAVHRAATLNDATDDAGLAEAAGLEVAMVEGDEANFKITTEADLTLAEQRLAAGAAEFRTGTGFDAHRLGPGDHVMLCGHRIAHDRGLIGHSDADVALHALTDAVLGAIGAGDIGQHFPPSDPRWRGAASARFLAHAAGLVQARGGAIVHVDVTLICEAPRIGPHREAMRDRLAAILGLPADRCSVKATTTERMGFAGRGEGIAAQAAATVRLPV